ncbi:MAG TPA: HEPN domain-containing protein [Thermoanaerobaculia bacterium]|nr:HEPN domain-containing protein [Thermoanaerobaculia bacterium]
MSQSSLLLQKAGRALRAAERLLITGDADFAASRTYYAYFYTAQALLLTQGLRFSRHGQVVAQYGRCFGRSKHLEPGFHRLLMRAFKIREVADYQVEVPVDPEEVEELLQEGRRFLEAASRYLQQFPPSEEDS